MKQNIERLALGGGALVIGLVLGWMVRGVATYSSGTETSTMYDDWRVVCPTAANKDASCAMAAPMVDPSSKQVLGNLSITKDHGQQVIGLTVPLDVALEPGLGLQINKDPLKVYKFRTCNADGCISINPADDALVASLAKADTVNIVFLAAAGDGKPLSMPVSTKGFDAARKAYLGNESRRTSWFWRLWS